MRRTGVLFELAFAVLTVWAAVPLWLVRHPPIEDLPQHLAAIRVLHSIGDPAFGLSQTFELTLSRTQYLAYYLCADLLAYPLGVRVANLVLVSASVIGTPWAMRWLLRTLGRDERHALFVLPLTYNAHLILGFFNFLAAIPLALVGLALAVQLREKFSTRRAVALAAAVLLTFYTHVVPFAFLGLGAALLGLGRDGPRAVARRWAPLVPGALAALAWSRISPAGQATATAALGADGGGPVPQFASAADALRDIPSWLTDVLQGQRDEQLLVGTVTLLLVAFALGAGAQKTDRTPSPRELLLGSLVRRVAWLAPLAGVLYFVTPASYDWIWPISARFPLLALVLLVPALPRLAGARALGVFTGVALVAALSFQDVSRAFVAFERDEVGELDDAIAAIPPGKRVAGLVWDRWSTNVKFAPFLHAVAYYQAEKGGAVMFTFADFPQSPFRFREEDRPPRVPPRWEWTPERVDPRRDLAWYEYVLVRGDPRTVARDAALYAPEFRGPHWSVWRRLDFREDAP